MYKRPAANKIYGNGALRENQLPSDAQKQYKCKYAGCRRPCVEAPSIICDGRCQYCDKEENAISRSSSDRVFKLAQGSTKIWREI